MIAGTTFAFIALVGADQVRGRYALPLGAAGGLVWALLSIALGERRGIRRAQPHGEVRPDEVLSERVVGFSLALGIDAPSVIVAESDAPNVAAFSRSGADVIVITTAARFGLAPAELDAAAALQLSLLNDPGARRVRRLLTAANQVFVPTLLISPIAAALIGYVFDGEFGGRLLGGITATVVLWIGFYSILRRMRWGWGLLSDGVAVETTRYPEPLVLALRRLAAHNGKPVTTRGWRGDADAFWIVPVRTNFRWSSSVDDKMRAESSTAMVSDAALLLRARIVDIVCVHSGPPTMATWRTAKGTFKRLSLAAGDQAGGATDLDNVIDGISVTAEGVAGGDIGPINGSWTPPER